MKKVIHQRFPPGWDEKKVREIIAYYDNQTDEEGAAEIEAADEVANETWMSIPTELVPAVARLIEEYQQKVSTRRSNSRQGGKARPRKRRKSAPH